MSQAKSKSGETPDINEFIYHQITQYIARKISNDKVWNRLDEVLPHIERAHPDIRLELAQDLERLSAAMASYAAKVRDDLEDDDDDLEDDEGSLSKEIALIR